MDDYKSNYDHIFFQVFDLKLEQGSKSEDRVLSQKDKYHLEPIIHHLLHQKISLFDCALLRLQHELLEDMVELLHFPIFSKL